MFNGFLVIDTKEVTSKVLSLIKPKAKKHILV